MLIIHNLNIPSTSEEVNQYLKLHGVHCENTFNYPNKLAILLAAKLHERIDVDLDRINPYNQQHENLAWKKFNKTYEYMISVMKSFNF